MGPPDVVNPVVPPDTATDVTVPDPLPVADNTPLPSIDKLAPTFIPPNTVADAVGKI